MVDENLADNPQETEVIEAEVAQPEQSETEEAKPEEAQSESAKADEEVEHRKRNARERIEQLARQKNEIKRDRDYWMNRALTSEGSRKELAEHEAEKLEAQEVKISADEWDAKISHAKANYPDFIDVVSSSTAIVNKDVERAVLESDNSTDLLYHLAKNPADVERLNSLGPRQLNKEIARLELKFETALQPEVNTPKVSKAPEPIKPAASNRGVVHKDPSQMSLDEYTAWRRSQGARY